MIPGARVTAGAIGSVIDLRTPRSGRVPSRGHVSRPVWELTNAVLSGRAPSAPARADVLSTMLSTGATSGGDTCAGLAAACRLLSRSLEGIMA